MSAHTIHANDTAERLQDLARCRARKKLGWYMHAAIYLMVNAALTALSLHQGKHWSLYPMVFWGFGLLVHGASVWLIAPRSAWWQRMVEREAKAIERERRADHGRLPS
ncbi:2TM domain-containing protein [Diaphorobacter aerolatus]|uniref:2TM domain-containing protein n=1 Tax=Diaphorobacter aerolatus TaxID=1288495 RepID=A0A7H0GIK3_9BURK|nr:2TM domain-containing protein [Diaphorobacter aerolatus]QNP48119.1 2TM domain-containing protein [Diaphorobacter aerolatus]